MSRRIKIAHVTTVDLTLRFLLLGQLRRLRDEGFDVVGISAPGPWVEELEGEGIRHIAWNNATRSWDPRSDALGFKELVGILRREGFDLVHTHNPKPGIIGRVAARIAGVPCVLNTVHGLYATPDDSLAKRATVLGLERLAARFSDLELYQSEEDLAWARRRRLVDPPPSVLLGNGTDLSRFDPARIDPARLDAIRSELDIGAEELVVGTVGRMVAEKGYGELFAAAASVRREHPEVRFLVVGEPDPEKADSLAEDDLTRAGEHVVFAGWRTDMPELLALMDVFVLASWREGVPRSAIEAAAMGRPLVLTDIRGCREVARDGVEGRLVPPRQVGRLASAILELVRNPHLRNRMGEAARARAIDRFDERAVAERVVSETRRLLGRKGVLREVAGPVRVRRARVADAATMARLHRENLPGAFLPQLGERFLRQLYAALARDREAVALVAENGGHVVGFAAGVPSVERFYRRFYLRRGFVAALAAAPRLLRRDVRSRVRETARYPQAVEALPEAELLSIAVAPECRARGVGRALARGIIDGLGSGGVADVKVVVGADDAGANAFYDRSGFQHAARIEVHEGIPSNVWVATASESDGGGG